MKSKEILARDIFLYLTLSPQMPALFMTSLIQTAWHKMAVGYSGPCYLDFQTSIFNIHSGPERDTLSVRSICLQVYFCLPPDCVQSVQFSSSEMFQRLLKRDGTKFRKKTILNVYCVEDRVELEELENRAPRVFYRH